MTLAWVYPEVGPYQVVGRDVSEDNFAQEDKSGLEILIREALQNPLDARAKDNFGAVKVRIDVLQPGNFDASYLSSLLGGEYRNRLEASGADPLPGLDKTSLLILEDFGTTGLQGTWDNPDVEGSDENWNAFWFREGEGAKPLPGSNGRAGQGKITYYRIGAARAVFGYTVRKSDSQSLLMGRSAFRRAYAYHGSRYTRHPFWCVNAAVPLPSISSEEIAAFRKAFKLVRNQESGLSIVIPCPVEFDPKLAIQTIITEFYYPIACGNLEVSIGGMEMTAAKIDSIAHTVLPDDVAKTSNSCFTKGFRSFLQGIIQDERSGLVPMELARGWDKTPSLKEDAFPEGALEALREKIGSGERVSVRCPVLVRPKKGDPIQTYFDVHLEMPEDLDQVEEAYIRRDLLIGSEKHLSGSSYLQKARSLTLIVNSDLSSFLADAEEPTHLKWNGSRPRLAEDYINPQATLRSVRNAAARLLSLLTHGMVSRDVKALAKYFTRPVEVGKHAAGGSKPQGNKTPEENTPPPSIRKPFRIVTGIDHVHIVPNGGGAPKTEDLPITCELEVAYEGLDQDPYKAYDPFDFDFADAKAYPTTIRGVTVITRYLNQLRFEVIDPDFSVEVSGFDPNIRLRARLNYMEDNNGATISEE